MQGEQVLANVIEYVFSPLYQLAVGLSFVYFLYGVLKFIWIMRDSDAGDAQKRNEGKQHMMWGTVGLFIILSVGGILTFFNNTLGGIFEL
jgi:Type IV secretion system pilin